MTTTGAQADAKRSIRRVILTGGPGAGKTTLLAELRRHGYAVVPESARAIISNRRRQGLSPRPAPAQFAQQILRADLDRYQSVATARADLAFFDRGLPDALGMLAQSEHLSVADRQLYLQRYPYHQPVFVLPPWQKIYRQDAERDQTYDESVRVHDSIRRWYVECGYELLEVPLGAVTDRCRFVLHALGENQNDS